MVKGTLSQNKLLSFGAAGGGCSPAIAAIPRFKASVVSGAAVVAVPLQGSSSACASKFSLY
jgi:hypothetical protein